MKKPAKQAKPTDKVIGPRTYTLSRDLYLRIEAIAKLRGTSVPLLIWNWLIREEKNNYQRGKFFDEKVR